MASRGMNMRDMKAQQMGKRPRGRPPKDPAARAEYDRRKSSHDRPPDAEETADEGMDDFALVDQGDGSHVPERLRPIVRDDESDDLPDAPPPGWCEDD